MDYLGFRLPTLGCRVLVDRLLVLFISCLLLSYARAADEREWEISNYRVKVHLAVDTSARPQPGLQEIIARHLEQRIFATIYPLLSVEISPATGPWRHTLIHQLDSLVEKSNDEPSSDHSLELTAGFDKEMFLAIVATAEGTQIACREVDRYTSTWSPVLSRDIRQARMLPEHCFDLLNATFAPLAKIRKDAEDEHQVQLLFKGNDLPRRSDEATFTQLGTVYQAIKIRTSRRGETRPDAVSQVPWTYLTLEEMEGNVGRCQVHTGIRQPFGVRRRGRVEHLAIAIRQPPKPTRVRFYARHDKTQSLVGYEVFQRAADGQPSQSMGMTDAHGSILVRPGEHGVTTLLLRSDGKLLAKLPVAPGALATIEVPIADDTARLKAQATLTSLREQLIDLVARRNILVARVRDRLESGDFDEARKFLGELDALPGRAHFAQLLSTAERSGRNRSTEPRVQANIEKMFADTRKLLGRFLSTRQISDLQSELTTAQSGNSG